MPKLSKSESNGLRRMLLDAAKRQTSTMLEIAQMLFEVYYSTVQVGETEIELAQAWEFENFNDYAERELGMHYTTARKYVLVHDELVSRGGIDVTTLPNSVTKLLILAKVSVLVDRPKLRYWIGKARDLSCCELEDAVAETYGVLNKKRNVSFQMKFSDIRKMYVNLHKAKEALGVNTFGETLVKVLEQWNDLQEKTGRLRQTG